MRVGAWPADPDWVAERKAEPFECIGGIARTIMSQPRGSKITPYSPGSKSA
jgi:hypothetical protein